MSSMILGFFSGTYMVFGEAHRGTNFSNANQLLGMLAMVALVVNRMPFAAIAAAQVSVTLLLSAYMYFDLSRRAPDIRMTLRYWKPGSFSTILKPSARVHAPGQLESARLSGSGHPHAAYPRPRTGRGLFGDAHHLLHESPHHVPGHQLARSRSHPHLRQTGLAQTSPALRALRTRHPAFDPPQSPSAPCSPRPFYSIYGFTKVNSTNPAYASSSASLSPSSPSRSINTNSSSRATGSPRFRPSHSSHTP